MTISLVYVTGGCVIYDQKRRFYDRFITAFWSLLVVFAQQLQKCLSQQTDANNNNILTVDR